MQLFSGLVLGALIGYLAYRAGALSASGAWAAALVGGLIFGLGGVAWAVLLLAFFLSSSALSRTFSARKIQASEKAAKGSRRDWGQVFANGGLGALLALLQALFPGLPWFWVAYAGALAAVNADTWATELGALSRVPPRLILSGEVVEPGSSGGVTWAGYLAALAGAALIGLGALAFPPLRGSLGLLVDSLLGATWQAIYYCPNCHKETERHPRHTCEIKTLHRRGLRWLNNDLVNLACSGVGAFTALVLWLLL
jgi:uncharacterized protein (TIGR00297 family)